MNKTKTKKPLSLQLDTLRNLSDDTLVVVNGGIDDIRLLCPSKTWGGSPSRSIKYL